MSELHTYTIYRLQLASLHCNENADHDYAITKEGGQRYDMVWPKFKKGGHVCSEEGEGGANLW